MAWLEIHQSLMNHRKTLIVSDILNIKPVYVVGHMVSLWLWCLDNAPSGNLHGVSARILASAAQWDGDSQTFLDALLGAGFLDEMPDCLVVHDWWDYAGRLIEKRQTNRERMRLKRATHVRCTCNARTPTTVPNSTQQNHDDCASPNGDDESPLDDSDQLIEVMVKNSPATKTNYSADFERFWDKYPRHINKQAAYKVWKARLKEGNRPDDLIRAAENYAAYCLRAKTAIEYVKHATTFLGHSRPFSEFVDGAPDETNIRRGPPTEVTPADDEVFGAEFERLKAAGKL